MMSPCTRSIPPAFYPRYLNAPYDPLPRAKRLNCPLVVLALGAMGIGSAILSLKTDSLVNKEVADARVARSADGEPNDNTCNPPSEIASAGRNRNGSPRGINSGGIFLRRLRRCETV
jgi:hypothetical protein